MNRKLICTACGIQFPIDFNAELCPICNDNRQYIPEKGQTWTDLDELSNVYSVIRKEILEHSIARYF